MRIFNSRGWLITRFMIMWALYAWALCIVYRLGMVLYDNNNLLASSTWRAFFESVVIGIRFDLAVIALLWFIPFSIANWPGLLSRFRRLWVIWLSRIALLVLVVWLVSDFVFYSAYGTHAGLELFNIGEWPQWYSAKMGISIISIVIAVVLFALIIWAMMPVERTLTIAKGHWHQAVIAFVVLVLMLRGGVTSRPLHVVDAFRGENPKAAMYAINGVYVSLREALSGQNERLPRDIFTQAYNRHDPEFQCTVVKRYVAPKAQLQQEPPNFIVVMLNGWQRSDIDDKNITEQYNALAEKSWNFVNAYSAGYGSQVGVYSVLTGSPPLGGSQQLAWGLANDRVPRIGHLLATREYTSMLVHGYDPQYLRLDLLTNSLGIDYYLTQEDLPLTNDPNTGQSVAQRDVLWDGVLEFADQVRGPFAAYIISPWRRYDASQVGSNGSEMEQQINEIDRQLGHFIEAARKRPWGDNTVFLLVGVDSEQKMQLEMLNDNWKVPLVMFGKGIMPKVDRETVGAAAILPTIIDMAGIDRPFASSAESLKKRQLAPTLIMQPPLVVGVNNDGYVRIAGKRTMDVSAFDETTTSEELERLEVNTFNELNCIWQRYEIFEDNNR